MKTFGRTNSVVESVASAAGSVRHQRDEALASLNQKGAEVSVWLDQMFKLYITQLTEMGPCHEQLAKSHEAGFESGDSLPRDLVTWIDSLKKKELQKELKGRELCTTGLKDELRERLIESMLDERRKAVDIEADQNNQEEPVEKVVQHLESMDISMEKSCPPVAKSKRAEQKKMQDVGAFAKDETSDPMEVEVPHEFTKPPPNNCPKAIGSSKHTGMENDRLAVKVSTDNVKSIGQVDNMKPAPETSPTKSPSRSPLRRMQSGVQSAFKNRMQNTVQSALRNLRPVSPKKVTEEPKRSSPKPKKQIVVLPQAFSTDETVSSNSSQSEVGITSTAAPPAPVVPIPGSARPYQTPATTGASTEKLDGIHSDKPKAATASRMARIAEMRNKSKQVANAMPPTLCAHSATTGSSTKTGANNKRQLLTNQMREKARLGEAATTNNHTSVAPSKDVHSQQQRPAVSASSSINEPIVKKDTTPPPAKQPRSPILSPLDTYDMSDHDGNSDTDEEEERARRVGKRVPNWAHSKPLLKALTQQYTKKTVDPEELFGEVDTCNLEAIFGRKKAKYQRRTSSGNWTRDKATVAEKLAFKRQMGYVQA